MPDRISQVGAQVLLDPKREYKIDQVGVQVLLVTEQERHIAQVGVQVLLETNLGPKDPYFYAQVF